MRVCVPSLCGLGLTNITPKDAGGNVVSSRAKDLRPGCLSSVESAGNKRFEWKQEKIELPLSTTGEMVPVPLTWHLVPLSYSVLNRDVKPFQSVRVYVLCCQANDRLELAAVDGNEGYTVLTMCMLATNTTARFALQNCVHEIWQLTFKASVQR